MHTMRRAAYSYVEMLAVITMIGILVALLLPAVQAAREAARRMDCARHLTQLITAVQLYELHHTFYPPGTLDRQGPILTQPAGYHHNWITQILPYLEQKAAYRHVDFRVGVYDARHLPLRRLEFQVLRCSSSPRVGRGYSDYAGVHHDTEAPIDVDNRGVFFLNSRLRYEDLGDGSTQTLFLGEKFTAIGDLGWMSGTRSTLRNTGVAMNVVGGVGPGRGGTGRGESLPKSPPPGVAAEVGPTDPPVTKEQTVDWLYGTFGPPRGDLPDDRERVRRPRDVRLAVGGFASSHPGGSQWALGDGSVRFLSGAINPTTYRALANRQNGELLDPDF